MPKANNRMNALVKMASCNSAFATKFAGPFHAVTDTASIFAPATSTFNNEVNYRPAVQQWTVRTP